MLGIADQTWGHLEPANEAGAGRIGCGCRTGGGSKNGRRGPRRSRLASRVLEEGCNRKAVRKHRFK
jgi:hypothetical protein